MNKTGWWARAKDGALAALAGWLAGWLFSFPFKILLAWRYVDEHVAQLPGALVEGLMIWLAFSAYIAVAGFVPILLPLVLLLPAQWVVRYRRLLIPLAPLAAMLAIDYRMGLLNAYHLEHREDLRSFFLSAPNFFVMVFALVAVWAYVRLTERRLGGSR